MTRAIKRVTFDGKLLFFAGLLLILLAAIGCGGGESEREDSQTQTDSAASNLDEDKSQAPGVEEEDAQPREGVGPLSARLYSNNVRTRHLFDGAVTAGKIAFVAVTVTVAAAATTGSSAANADLAGGVLVGCTPAGNQDVFLDNAVLNADGSITLTTGAAAVAINTFRCIAWKANAKGIS